MLPGGGGGWLLGHWGGRPPPGMGCPACRSQGCPFLDLTPALQLTVPVLPSHPGRARALGCPGSSGWGHRCEGWQGRGASGGPSSGKARHGPASQSPPWWEPQEGVGTRSAKSLVRQWGPLLRERGQVWGEGTAQMGLCPPGEWQRKARSCGRTRGWAGGQAEGDSRGWREGDLGFQMGSRGPTQACRLLRGAAASAGLTLCASSERPSGGMTSDI